VKLRLGAAGLVLAAASLAPAEALQRKAAERVVDVRNAQRPTSGITFGGLFSTYAKADKAGDVEGARRAFQEIRRLRIERNVLNLDEIALALVARGKERLDKGERDAAVEHFASASHLAPNLPDAHLGLALAQVKRGLLGILPAAKSTAEAFWAWIPTARGRYHGFTLVVPVALISLFVSGAIFATAILLRHGPLLRHDLEEALGGGRSPSVALALHTLLLLLPVATFQGWGWLFPWWLALLLLYMNWKERLVSLFLLFATLAVGPAMELLEARMETARNPLFWAAVSSVEGASDPRAIAALEKAVKATPDDRDLNYLLATQLRKAGRYEDAAARYRELLRANPDDPVAQNNLANLDFARGEFPAALARYRDGAEKATDNDAKAVFFYNQSLAHLQRFEMQPADEALSQARRFSAGLISNFDRLWKYDKGDYAVVDMGLTTADIEKKFLGAPKGIGRKNLSTGAEGAWASFLLPSMLNRFAGFLAVAVLALIALSFWRGRRTFTMRCLKCGTPFCKRCHLGAAVAGLCTQCYHLFVVRDGVSGPARNRKLIEVQSEEGRQGRTFRLLSLLLPGAGQVYGEAPLLGFLLSFFLATTVVLAALAGRVFPVTEASRALAGRPWGLALAGAVALVIYLLANRWRTETDINVPTVRRGGRGKGRG
jgi:tetratricopeptide (TPR) repeat protein